MDVAKKEAVKAFDFHIDAADEVGNKMKTVVVKASLNLVTLVMKLCTSDGKKRGWYDSWWNSAVTYNAQKADNHASEHNDIKTNEYNSALGCVKLNRLLLPTIVLVGISMPPGTDTPLFSHARTGFFEGAATAVSKRRPSPGWRFGHMPVCAIAGSALGSAGRPRLAGLHST